MQSTNRPIVRCCHSNATLCCILEMTQLWFYTIQRKNATCLQWELQSIRALSVTWKASVIIASILSQTGSSLCRTIWAQNTNPTQVKEAAPAHLFLKPKYKCGEVRGHRWPVHENEPKQLWSNNPGVNTKSTPISTPAVLLSALCYEGFGLRHTVILQDHTPTGEQAYELLAVFNTSSKAAHRNTTELTGICHQGLKSQYQFPTGEDRLTPEEQLQDLFPPRDWHREAYPVWAACLFPPLPGTPFAKIRELSKADTVTFEVTRMTNTWSSFSLSYT